MWDEKYLHVEDGMDEDNPFFRQVPLSIPFDPFSDIDDDSEDVQGEMPGKLCSECMWYVDSPADEWHSKFGTCMNDACSILYASGEVEGCRKWQGVDDEED